MFNLEKEILKWKKNLKKYQGLEEGYIEELESHLRDSIEQISKAHKYSAEESFLKAVQNMKVDDELNEEFKLAGKSKNKNLSDSILASLRLSLLINYLKVASRMLIRDKIYSTINISGLTIGLVAAVILGLWTDHELSFDKFHDEYQNIYRVISIHPDETGSERKYFGTPALLAEAAQKEIPEILLAARYNKSETEICKTDDVAFYEEGIASCDPLFLEMFSFALQQGNLDNAFKDSHTIVITERLAEKYFGTKDVIGKTLNWNNWQEYKIGAVIKDVPANSHLQFDFLTTFEIEKRSWPQGFSWRNFNRSTYVKLVAGADIASVEKKITNLLQKHNETARLEKIRLLLQPLEDIHLTADVGGDPAHLQSREKVVLFLVTGILILAIACFNFLNLSLAKAAKRLREIGIRKTIGANKIQAFTQQLIEIFFQVFTASGIAVVAVNYLLPLFNKLTGNNIVFGFKNFALLSIFLAIIFVTTLISGIYPAIIISGIQPVKILKNDVAFSFKNSFFRKSLVVFQFAVSFALIIITITIYNQYEFVQTSDVGFNKAGVIRIPIKDQMQEKFETFKTSLLKNPDINSVAVKDIHPLRNMNRNYVTKEGMEPNENSLMNIVAVGYDYFSLMEMDMLVGREFSKEYSNDLTSSFIINETAAAILDLDNPVGEQIKIDNHAGQVIGLVKDAKLKSLYSKVQPEVYHLYSDLSSNVSNLYGVILIRYNGDPGRAIEVIGSEWAKIIPNFPLVTHFLDEDYYKVYSDEKTTMLLLALLAGLAILISTLGVFGLSAVNLQNKLKEIGIRKTLGASIISIVSAYLKEIYTLVAVASVAAIPAGYFLSVEWLKKFEFNTGFKIEAVFFGAAVLLLSILISLTYYASKSYFINPAKVLKDE